jgi:hypothetical protein
VVAGVKEFFVQTEEGGRRRWTKKNEEIDSDATTFRTVPVALATPHKK